MMRIEEQSMRSIELSTTSYSNESTFHSATRTLIVVQARTGSSRLPMKVVKPFYGAQTILDIILEKLNTSRLTVVLATTELQSDDVVASIGRRHHAMVHRGAELDVVSRFLEATEGLECHFIVRVCADNPFLDIGLLNELLSAASTLSDGVDYVAHRYRGLPSIATPFGVFAELVSRDALVRVYNATGESIYREHVTNYIHQRPENFQVHYLDIDPDTFLPPPVRMTVDTPEDFEIASELYARLMTERSERFSLADLRDTITAHPELLHRMSAESAKSDKSFLFEKK